MTGWRARREVHNKKEEIDFTVRFAKELVIWKSIALTLLVILMDTVEEEGQTEAPVPLVETLIAEEKVLRVVEGPVMGEVQLIVLALWMSW